MIQTLEQMRKLTVEAIQSQAPRSVIVNLIHRSYLKNPEMLAAALDRWIRLRFTVIDEFEELLISPIILLRDIRDKGQCAGDCDDCAMLSASLLASAGSMVRFRCTGDNGNGTYSHVFVQYKFPRRDEWNNFDATVPLDSIIWINANDLIFDIIS
jgi:transglutaminase-like putative cysteine protease